MTGIINDAIAVDMGNEVLIRSVDRHGMDVSFSLKKQEYEMAKNILINGIGVDKLSNTITPHDIVGYLYESNPESQNVMVDVEVQRGIRQKAKDVGKMVAYGGAFATIIMAMVIFYLAVVKDPSAAVDVVNSATGAASSGVTVV